MRFLILISFLTGYISYINAQERKILTLNKTIEIATENSLESFRSLMGLRTYDMDAIS